MVYCISSHVSMYIHTSDGCLKICLHPDPKLSPRGIVPKSFRTCSHWPVVPLPAVEISEDSPRPGPAALSIALKLTRSWNSWHCFSKKSDRLEVFGSPQLNSTHIYNVHPFKGPLTSIDLNLIDFVQYMTMKKTALVLFWSPSSKFLFTLDLVVRIFTKPPKDLQIHVNDMGYFWILYIHSISHENPTPIISHYTWWLYHISYIPLKSINL